MTAPCPACGNLDTVGYEVDGVYDGVLYQRCQRCGTAFQRHVDSNMRALAAPFIRRANALARSCPECVE